ncbi:MAG: hypothetical protein M0Q53_07475 [Prolixibacteraceae bacterium]|jgi:hypothetical protein|nr:hypothetical protein [Prolixibacteraceae bacterium]
MTFDNASIMIASLIIMCSWGEEGYQKQTDHPLNYFVPGLTDTKDGQKNCLSMDRIRITGEGLIPAKPQ